MGGVNHFKMLKKFLPPGKALLGIRFLKLIEALSEEFRRVDELALQLLENEIPGTLDFQLESWEKIVGVNVGTQDKAVRNKEVVAKLSSVAGQSTHFWEVFLRRITGDQWITVSFPRVLRAGFRAGDRAYDPRWNFVFFIENYKNSDKSLIQDNVEVIKQAHISALLIEANHGTN